MLRSRLGICLERLDRAGLRELVAKQPAADRAVGVDPLRDRVGRTDGMIAPGFGAHRESDRTGPGREWSPAQVGGEDRLGRDQPEHRAAVDVGVERQRAVAEDIDRNAARRARAADDDAGRGIDDCVDGVQIFGLLAVVGPEIEVVDILAVLGGGVGGPGTEVGSDSGDGFVGAVVAVELDLAGVVADPADSDRLQIVRDHQGADRGGQERIVAADDEIAAVARLLARSPRIGEAPRQFREELDVGRDVEPGRGEPVDGFGWSAEQREQVLVLGRTVVADHGRAEDLSRIVVQAGAIGAERDALERAADDQPARRGDRGMDVGRDDEIRQAVGREIGIGDQADIAPPPVAGQLGADAADPHIVEAGHDVPAAAAEAGAAGQRQPALLAVVLPGYAARNRRPDALQVVLEDDVDDPGDGVRTVGGRGAAGDHLDAIDEQGGNDLEVDRAGGRRRHVAAAVNQDQGAALAQTAQIGVDLAAAARGDPGGVGRIDLAEARDLLEHFADGRRLAVLDRLAAEHGEGGRGLDAGGQARTGDDDLIRWRRLRDERRGTEQERRGKRQAAACGNMDRIHDEPSGKRGNKKARRGAGRRRMVRELVPAPSPAGRARHVPLPTPPARRERGGRSDGTERGLCHRPNG
jgi:hypothetical protein